MSHEKSYEDLGWRLRDAALLLEEAAQAIEDLSERTLREFDDLDEYAHRLAEREGDR